MRSYDVSEAEVLCLRPQVEVCEVCGANLWIVEHQKKFVHGVGGLYYVIRQGVRCPVGQCPGSTVVQRVPVDLRLVLPKKNYGTEVVVEVGERHLQHGDSFGRIARSLQERGVPLSKRHSGRLFRAYVALTQAALGDEKALCERLRAQGGILLMADGVQYDHTSPVLYMVWDALSGTPLFGERKAFRSAEDLVPLLERVKTMDVDVVGIVSDKEKGLVPAVAEVFPDVPHQYCQLHYLKNCALGMKSALGALGKSVASRADKVQRISKRLHVRGWDSLESDQSSKLERDEAGADDGTDGPTHAAAAENAPADAVGRVQQEVDEVATEHPKPLSEEQLAVELCAMARHASRATGRAPLNPPEQVRHERLEAVRAVVAQAREKGATIRSLIASMTR